MKTSKGSSKKSTGSLVSFESQNQSSPSTRTTLSNQARSSFNEHKNRRNNENSSITSIKTRKKASKSSSTSDGSVIDTEVNYESMSFTEDHAKKSQQKSKEDFLDFEISGATSNVNGEGSLTSSEGSTLEKEAGTIQHLQKSLSHSESGDAVDVVNCKEGSKASSRGSVMSHDFTENSAIHHSGVQSQQTLENKIKGSKGSVGLTIILESDESDEITHDKLETFDPNSDILTEENSDSTKETNSSSSLSDNLENEEEKNSSKNGSIVYEVRDVKNEFEVTSSDPLEPQIYGTEVEEEIEDVTLASEESKLLRKDSKISKQIKKTETRGVKPQSKTSRSSASTSSKSLSSALYKLNQLGPTCSSISISAYANRQTRSHAKMKHANTYQLSSKEPFSPDMVKNVLESVVQRAKARMKFYDEVSAADLAVSTAGEIRSAVLAKTFDRYRLSVLITIGEKRLHGFHMDARLLLDKERDSFASHLDETSSYFILAVCFGIYKD